MTKSKPATKLEPFDIVCLEWEDAHASSAANAGTINDAMNTYRPYIRRTVGYYIGQTKDVVVLASDDDRLMGTAGNLSEDCGGLIYTPRKMVRAISRVAKTTLVSKKK